MKRAAGSEMMDAPDADPAQLEQSLGDIRAVNRWLGATRELLWTLGRSMARHPRTEYALLDVATGSADIPLAVAEWAERRGIRARIVATDFHAETVQHARRRVHGHPRITAEMADARRLPYADGSFDYALLCTAFHHFDPEEAVAVLAELGRVSRIGVVVTDLRRGLPGLVGAWLLARTIWRGHPMTRHDGPLSVRRSYTAREARELAIRAGLPGVRTFGLTPIRWTMLSERA